MSHFLKHPFKVLLIVVFIITLLSSCTNILFDNLPDYGNGLDFTTGAWLLNEIESVSAGKPDNFFYPRLYDGLKKMGINSITFLNSAKNLGSLPNEIPFHTSPEILKSIKDSSDYDYLINVRTKIEKKESGGIAFGEQDLQNQAGIEIIVFDINQSKKIYYEEMIAIEIWPTQGQFDETKPNRFSFTRSTENLLKNALRRILRDLKRNSKIASVRAKKNQSAHSSL